MDKGSPENLSVEELRRLLVERRRVSRQERMAHFRRTGRVVVVSPDVEGAPLESLRSGIMVGKEDAIIRERRILRRKRIVNGLLLLVEVLAVSGLLFILYNGINLVQELNREVQAALVQPTLTPTPLISAVVLPSGHTPPNSPGGAQPNEAEIPEHLRQLLKSQANIPIPTPGPEQAIRIQIPAINVDAPIVQGDGWEQLKKGVGQRIGSANPGEASNVVLSAHNDIFGEIFRDLDRLKTGNEVIIHTNQRVYTYIVIDSQVVEPTRVEVMEPSHNPVVTLISCYPYLIDTHRIVVTARLQEG